MLVDQDVLVLLHDVCTQPMENIASPAVQNVWCPVMGGGAVLGAAYVPGRGLVVVRPHVVKVYATPVDRMSALRTWWVWAVCKGQTHSGTTKSAVRTFG